MRLQASDYHCFVRPRPLSSWMVSPSIHTLSHKLILVSRELQDTSRRGHGQQLGENQLIAHFVGLHRVLCDDQLTRWTRRVVRRVAYMVQAHHLRGAAETKAPSW